MKRALLIGSAGFVGRHVADAVTDAGWRAIGAGRGAAPPGWSRDWVSCDLHSAASVTGAVTEARPDAIFHLAGAPLDSVDELLAVHVAGTARLLDAVRTTKASARVIVVGSAAEYGAVQSSELPVVESVRPRPRSLYGIAKTAQTLVALRPGVDAVVGRLFNISGPDEPPSLVCGSFASQIAKLERGGDGGAVTVGALEPRRDFVDVRDAARALVALAERGRPGEAYNVCSGVATQIGEVLSMLAGRAEVTVEPRYDPARGGGPGIPTMVGSAAKLAADTGWEPLISLEQTLGDLLAWYRSQN
jgi:GDP-4-dehydro-6-deoxy-D-mannose reductase